MFASSECKLNEDFYGNLENFLALVGLEATIKEIDNVEANITEIKRHLILMPGKDVIEHFKGRSKKTRNIEFSALPFMKDTPQYAKSQKNRWVQHEKNFKNIIKEEERRQEAEYRDRKCTH